MAEQIVAWKVKNDRVSFGIISRWDPQDYLWMFTMNAVSITSVFGEAVYNQIKDIEGVTEIDMNAGVKVAVAEAIRTTREACAHVAEATIIFDDESAPDVIAAAIRRMK